MLRELHEELGISADYGRSTDLPVFQEAGDLVDVGLNLVGRMQRLAPDAARQWNAMLEAATQDSITLMIVSGFRSVEYQAALIRKKINAGQVIDEILTVNAAPGHSEHHTGLAIDIATPGSRPLTEDFESTDAFGWLGVNADRFGFSMTYPRNNRWGIVYEPWHWCQKG
jgi:D-alanyl-D-alanine carboxypeptidase